MEVLVVADNSLPSPALTNPDMILPYHTHTHHATPSPPPNTRQDSFQRHNMKGVPPLGDDADHGYFYGMSSNISMARYQQPVEAFRPPLPGAWQTEEDIHNTYTRPRGHSPAKSSSRLCGEDVVKISDEYQLEDQGKMDWNFSGAYALGDGNNTRRDDKPTLPMGREFEENEGPQNELNNVYEALDGDEADPTSHAALSSRAEQILANAKKRLLEMEDNLSRARHSLKDSPSATIAFTTRDPMPIQIHASLRGYRSRDNQDLKPTRPRRTSSARSSGNIAGHSRYFSETSVPDQAEKQKSTRDQRRMSSAMGTVSANTKSEEHLVDDTNEESQGRSLGSLNHSVSRQRDVLWPLQEDSPLGTPLDIFSPYEISPFGSEGSRPGGHGRVPSKTSYFSAKPKESNELTRSRSTTQLRDLREQMQELRGKVTSLKQQTREDRLQRRSLQTLKQPSPFTVAPNWTEECDHGEQVGGNRDLVENANVQAIPAADAESKQEPESLDQNKNLNHDSVHPEAIRNEIPSGKLGTLDSIAASNDKLNQEQNLSPETPIKVPVRKVLPSPHGEKHEDRPDAFDYEHYFLHSGMVTPGRTPQSQRYSHSSSDSAETTKANGPETWAKPLAVLGHIPHLPTNHDTPTPKNTPHFRQNSVDSVSTTATFATATENSEINKEHPLWNSAHAQPHQHSEPRRRRANSSKDQRVQNGTYLTFPNASRHQYSNPTPPFSPTQALASSFPLPPSPLPRRTSSSSPPHPSSLHLVTAFLSSSETRLGTTDSALVERLLTKLQTACRGLNDDGVGSGNGSGKGRYERRTWRRRVDAARRVLEGEMD